MVSAIELLPAPAEKVIPLRLRSDGRRPGATLPGQWRADSFPGGNALLQSQPADPTTPDNAFTVANGRWAFSYALPVPAASTV